MISVTAKASQPPLPMPPHGPRAAAASSATSVKRSGTGGGGDSGHETLVSTEEDDSPTPTVERASSEVIYSSIGPGSNGPGTGTASGFARTRHSLAEPPSSVAPVPLATSGSSVPIYEDIDQFHSQPPMIAPVSGVPNIKGKAVIRPIAFRPTPVAGSAFHGSSGKLSGASTPTNASCTPQPPGSLNPLFRSPAVTSSSNAATPTHGFYGRAHAVGGPPSVGGGGGGVAEGGFLPGHPLVKDGRRHYGSSQELHMTSQPPLLSSTGAGSSSAIIGSTFSKFNSLDRRALMSRRQQHQNLKLAPSAVPGAGSMHHLHQHHHGPPHHLHPFGGHQHSGAESLPLPQKSPSRPSDNVALVKKDPQHHQPQLLQPMERRHSSYDSSTSRSASCTSVSRFAAARQSIVNAATKHLKGGGGGGGGAGNININGLPDPVRGGGAATGPTAASGSSIYSSHENLRTMRSISGGAGTPQFQNLSGAVRNASQAVNGRTSITLGKPHLTTGPASIPVTASSSSSSSGRPPSSSQVPLAPSGSSAGSSSFGTNNGQTPSPSDSAVGDLETILKEKDTEINYLRETMEQNEQVIFKVYEEKEKMWERELRKIKGLYDNRLRSSQQKSSKMEQALSNQTFQLQTDKRRLETELDDTKNESSERVRENSMLKQQIDSLRKTLDESEWSSCAKSGEISFLQSQIALEQQQDVNGETTATSGSTGNGDEVSQSVAGLGVQVRELKTELERRVSALSEAEQNKKSLQTEISSLKRMLQQSSSSSYSSGDSRNNGASPQNNPEDDGDDEEDDDDRRSTSSQQKQIIISRDRQIERLERELESARSESALAREEAARMVKHFEAERIHWLDEKEKVIRYQKQLQLNYVQMYKRNKALEAEIDSAARQLEAERARAGAAEAKAKSAEAKAAAAPAGGTRVKKSNSMRAKLFKMSLINSESQC